MTDRQPNVRPAPFARTGGRRAFTLTELLVVISIIVLLLLISVPLFSVFAGGRSVESGQNIVSSMLQRARSRAIALQERRGIFFFDDQTNRKTGMLMVKIDDLAPSGPSTSAPVLELDQDNVEVEYLPAGIGAAFPLGVDPSNNTVYKPTGLIVFDGFGRIETVIYTPVAKPDPVRYPNGTFLAQQYGANVGPIVMGTPSGGLGITTPELSEVALSLYDRRGLASVESVTQPTPGITFSTEQYKWLDLNGAIMAVNRYNGTLIRGE